MVHITIDTEKDSPSTIQRVIEILQEELSKKGHEQPIMTYEEQTRTPTSEPQTLNTTRSNVESRNSETPNPFEMFGSGLPSSGGVQPKQKLDVPVGTAIEEPAPSNDLFGAFNNEPSQETQSYQEHTPRREPQRIILDPPAPRNEPQDYEGSALFAKQVMAQDLINEGSSTKKNDGFFKDLEEW